MTDTVGPVGPGLAGRLGWRAERRPRPGFAHVLGALAYWLAPVLGEPDDGYEPVPPPTVPPGGDSATTTLPHDAARRRSRLTHPAAGSSTHLPFPVGPIRRPIRRG